MRVIVVAWLALLVVACAEATPPDPEFGVSADSVALAAGRSAMVSADRPEVSWTSDRQDIAIVVPGPDGTATIRGVAVGTTTIAATLGAVARSIDVTVTAAELDTIEIVASRDTVPRGLALQLEATGTYSDGHTEDLSSVVAWASDASAVASVTDDGMVTANTVGRATITATNETITGELAMTVSDAELSSITMTTPTGPLPKGTELQLVVTGLFTDASSDDITDLVTWATTNEAIATVDHGGLVRAVAATGTARITAMANGLEASTDVVAAPAVLAALSITPSPLVIPLGTMQSLVATGMYSDGVPANLTASVAWSIQTGTAVTVTAGGVARAVATGAATVRATYGSVTATADATVGAAVADRLELSSGDATLMQGQRVRLRARMVYSDGARVDVTAAATWSAAGSSVTVAGGQLDAGAAPGATTITALADGKSASMIATVGATACHLVINEVQAAGVSASDEWVELYNPCAATIDVTGWTVVYRASSTTGASDTNNLQTLAGPLASGDFRLYVGPGFPGTGFDGARWGGSSGLVAGANGAIGLRSGPKDTGPLVDAVAYGSVNGGHPFIETATAPALATGKSVARLPFDGVDTNHNANNFTLVMPPTPRATNAP